MIRINEPETNLVPTKVNTLLCKWLHNLRCVPQGTLLDAEVVLDSGVTSQDLVVPMLILRPSTWEWNFLLTPDTVRAIRDEPFAPFSHFMGPSGNTRNNANWQQGAFTEAGIRYLWGLQNFKVNQPERASQYSWFIRCFQASKPEFNRYGLKYMHLMLPENFKEDALSKLE